MKGWVVLIGAVVLVGVLLSLDGPAAGSGTFPVEIIGPDDTILEAEVTLSEATAYRVLEQALEEAGIPHTVQGTGEDLFVTSIAGHANQGAAGWCFDVWDAGWHRPALGAGAYGLHGGQATRWVYESEGCGPLA